MPKLWISGVGTLCAIAHSRAALFYFNVSGKKPDVIKFTALYQKWSNQHASFCKLMFEVYQCMTSFGSIATRATFIPLLRSIYCKHTDQNFEVIDNYASIVCTLCYSFGIIFGQCFIGGFILERYGFYISNYIMGSLCGISGFLAAVILVKEKLLFTRFPPMSIYQPRYILDADDTIEVDA